MKGWVELQRRLVRLLMKLAPSYPNAQRQLVWAGQAEPDIETHCAYFNEGGIGAGSFRGYFRISIENKIFGKSLLDLGSGSGGRSAYWKKEASARTVVGLDIYPDEVITAHKTVKNMGIEVSFTAGLGEVMPFREAVLETIMAFDVLEHVQYPEVVLRECYRVLSPGGVFLAVFPPFSTR
jgi:2-polyprenyl-3-methyl-5-hydroxy-6-metoxy-1,4-benzoquinol methylase